MAYFERLSPTRFRATELTSGAWKEDEQHISPAIGLLTHLIERDHAARRSDAPLQLARLSVDIFGVIPIAEFDVELSVRRGGRTIELVEAELSHAGRTVCLARAWMLQPNDTGDIDASALPRIPAPEQLGPFTPAEVWPGKYIGTLQARRTQFEPGRAMAWLRSGIAPLDGEPVSRLAMASCHLDASNGMAVRADPAEVFFPNVDLTAHFFRTDMTGDWLGIDTSVSFGDTGLGLTHSVLHDARGPIGVLTQALTVRTR